MREIATIEVSALVNELKALAGYYFDKFYELGRGRFKFRLSRQGDRKELLCILKHTLNITDYVEKGGQESNFYAAVRKRITGYKIESIEQINEDRIIDIEASKGEDRLHLIIEMFGRGNLLIADSSMKIMLAYTQEEFKDRKIRTGEIYQPPASNALPISKINAESVANIINDGKESRVTSGVTAYLAKAVNVGSLYIENAVIGAGVDPKSGIDQLGKGEAERVAEGIAALKRFVSAPEPFVYMKEGKTIDYAICSIERYKGMEAKSMESVQAALDLFYHTIEEPKPATEESNEAQAIRKSIEKQRELLKITEEGIVKSRRAGEIIFKNTSAINSIIMLLREKKRLSKEELQALLPDVKIVELDLKNKTVTIDLD
jgi:predicted ribosome quality control (RQC) complex YloA/Tae2 family protein